MTGADIDLALALTELAKIVTLLLLGLSVIGSIVVVSFYEGLLLAMEHHDKHLLQVDEDAEVEEALAHFGDPQPLTTINVKKVI